VEVNRGEAVLGKNRFYQIILARWRERAFVRFHDVSEDLRRCVLNGVTVRRGIRVQGLHHRFHEFGKIGMDDKRLLRDKFSENFSIGG